MNNNGSNSVINKIDLKKIIITKKSIGNGSYSNVAEVYIKEFNKYFALKTIEISKIENEQQFKQEILLQSSLNNNNIIKLYNYLYTKDKIYLLLELAEKGNLYSLINSNKNISQKSYAAIFWQICNAINYLHSRNIIHRDIKPENILICNGNIIKLADFGSSIRSESKRKTFCGTFEYIAPEIYENKGYTNKIDIWGLGILYYELLHGYSPFRGDNFFIIYKKIIEGKIFFKKDIPDYTIKLILWMLNINPEKRPSISQLLTCKYWKYFTNNIDSKPHNNIINKSYSKDALVQKRDSTVKKNKYFNTENKKYISKLEFNNQISSVVRNKKIKTKSNMDNINLITNKQSKNMVLNLNINNSHGDLINISINNNLKLANNGFYTERIKNIDKV